MARLGSLRRAAKGLALGACLLLAASPGHAAEEMTLAEYRASATGATLPAPVRDYVDGIGTGYVWANALLAARAQPRIFCTPGDSAPPQDFVALLDRQIASHAGLHQPYADDTALAMILLDALINDFPCESSPPGP